MCSFDQSLENQVLRDSLNFRLRAEKAVPYLFREGQEEKIVRNGRLAFPGRNQLLHAIQLREFRAVDSELYILYFKVLLMNKRKYPEFRHGQA